MPEVEVGFGFKEGEAVISEAILEGKERGVRRCPGHQFGCKSQLADRRSEIGGGEVDLSPKMTLSIS